MLIINALLASLAFVSADPVVVNPSWVTAPAATGDDYPRFASLVRAEGYVTVQCQSLPSGALSACTAMSERPAGLGFGDRAVRVAQRGVTAPRTVDGVAVESRIQVRIPFQAPPAEAEGKPAPWTGPEPSEEQRESARRWAGRMTSSMPPPSARFGLEDLDNDRRAIVGAWVDELYPDQNKTREIFSIAAARLMAQIGLREMPQARPLDEVTWRKRFAAAGADQFDSGAADAELRRRYCARYECAPDR